jgi:hypothetical protein
MNENNDSAISVYSHGFGEMGEGRVDFKIFDAKNKKNDFFVIYPDAPGKLGEAVFYTQPAVHVLANFLHEQVINNKKTSVVIVGRSCGAGTVFNCLAHLFDYDQDYFKGSKISSKEDANKILQAVNNGALITVVPFLGLHKANAVAMPSKIMACGTIGAIMGMVYYKCGSFFLNECVGPIATRVGFSAATLTMGSLFVDCFKNLYAAVIVHGIVPPITGNKFDPLHVRPIESVEKLRGKLTCPILLQFCQNDKVLESPDSDTIKVYDALKGDKTHIIINNDGWHNELSYKFFYLWKAFKNFYISSNDNTKDSLKGTQPTIEELRRQIYPKDIGSILSRNKALVGAIFLSMSLMVLFMISFFLSNLIAF